MWSDWHIAGRRFGIIAGTPPTNLVVEHNLMDQTAIYPLDGRYARGSARRIAWCSDVATGSVDVGLIWGPIAGYYAKPTNCRCALPSSNPEASKVRLDYHIAMGVRPGDVEFRRRLNGVIAKDQRADHADPARLRRAFAG